MSAYSGMFMRRAGLRPACCAAFLALLAAAAPARAASPAERADVEASLAALTNGLSRFTLENGLKALIKEDRSAPLFAAQCWIGTGAANEDEQLGSGLSHWMEHMIFKGTSSRPPGTIAREMADLGGSIGAYTAIDRTVFSAQLPVRHWRKALEILADAMRNASFPEEEWEREKQVIRREMAMDMDNPGRRLARLLWETAFRVHPYRVPVIGYPEPFGTLTRDDLLKFFRRHYTPDNIILSLAGAVDAAAAERAVRDLFGGWERRARAPAALPAEPRQIEARAARAAGPYAVTRAAVCWRTVALSHPDAPALDLLAAVAGEGRSSRLVAEIKEKRKLCHSIGAWSYTPLEPGLFGISAVCDPEREEELLEAVLSEAERWAAKPFAAEELERARREKLVNTIAGMQTADGQAAAFASGEFYAGTPSFFLHCLRRLDLATPESLSDVARRYLRPENRTVAVLAPEGRTQRAAVSQPPAAGPVEKTVLRAGLPLLTRHDRRLPMVWISAACGGGLTLENEDNNGISALTAEMLIRGAGGRDAGEIARTVESLGASLDAYAGNNSFGLRAQCLAQDAETMIRMVAECLLAPTFAESDLAKLKPIQLAAIKQQRESPVFVAQEALRRRLFPAHPYRFTPTGSRRAIENTDAALLKKWHAMTVVSGNTVLAVFGDIPPERARALAERYFKAIPPGPPPRPTRADVRQPELPQRLRLVEPREQAIFLAGFPGISFSDTRFDALNVLRQTMTGLSSELMIEIRDKRGLAYFAGAINQPGVEPGYFAIYAGTRPEAFEQVEDMVRREIRRAAQGGIGKDELERARQTLLSEQAQLSQLNGELALDCALNELYGFGYARSLETAQRLENVSAQAVREAAASLLDTNRMAVVLVAPAPRE